MRAADDIRAMFRAGDKIGALRALRSDGATLAEARTTLELITTDDDRAAFRTALAARVPPASWVETAPGIYEPANQVAPTCERCDDTHRMELGGAIVSCTACPVPCQECRAGGVGAFCESTPCSCSCHVRARAS